jgi:signal transduction histidine kinase
MRVAVVTPNAADRELALEFLHEERIETLALQDVAGLGGEIDPQIGCIVLVEEALVEPDVENLHALLQAQPAWSDIPLLLIAAGTSTLTRLVAGLFPQSGNVTMLQRPLHPASLASAAQVALRARAKQLEVRDLLAQRDHAVRQRDEFLAMLAHELRNPLAPIRNAAYLLGTLDYDDPVFVKSRAMIEKQAVHITRLVDDLLDISRLELGKMQVRLKPIDLNESIVAAVDSCSNLTSTRRHTVNLRLSRRRLPVHADPVRLEQVVCNLLVNAAKFTPDGGTIEVESRAEDRSAVIVVSDNGIGIKPEMLESVFDLFTQDAVTIARTKGGLGIGLTLVKRLVELHGGTVRAESRGLGTGSRFVIRFPVHEKPVEMTDATITSGDARPKRILIVEDGSDTRDSLGMLIERWNHEVFYAASGPEGVDRARDAHPDVALIDIGLPGFDGYQVATRIRHEGSAWSRNVRLIAVTGYGQETDRAKALAAGFDVHVLKPVDPVQLKALLG